MKCSVLQELSYEPSPVVIDGPLAEIQLFEEMLT